MFSHAPWERLSGPIRDLTTGLAQLSKTKRPMNSATAPSAAGAVAAPDPEIHHPAGGSGPDGGHPEGDMVLAGARTPTPAERVVELATDWLCGPLTREQDAELAALTADRDYWPTVVASVRNLVDLRADRVHPQDIRRPQAAREVGMTATITSLHPVEKRLERLAERWLDDNWTFECLAELRTLASDELDEPAVSERFVAFAHAVWFRDGVDAGSINWREVEPELTCDDRQAAAYDIACGWVADAARALTGGGR